MPQGSKLSQSSQDILNGAASGHVSALVAVGISVFCDNVAGWQITDASRVAEADNIVATYSGSASELSFAQKAKVAALEAKYETIIAAGRLYSVAGGTDASRHVYQIDEVPPFDAATGRPTRRDSQGTISTMGAWAGNAVSGVAGTAPWPANFAWRDANNDMVPMTAAQCYAFTQDAAAYIAALFENYCAIYAQIGSAVDAATVRAIDVTAGWPANP